MVLFLSVASLPLFAQDKWMEKWKDKPGCEYQKAPQSQIDQANAKAKGQNMQVVLKNCSALNVDGDVEGSSYDKFVAALDKHIKKDGFEPFVHLSKEDVATNTFVHKDKQSRIDQVIAYIHDEEGREIMFFSMEGQFDLDNLTSSNNPFASFSFSFGEQQVDKIIENEESLRDCFHIMMGHKTVMNISDKDWANALVVINGTEHPELHELSQALAYLRKRNCDVSRGRVVLADQVGIKKQFPKNKKPIVLFLDSDTRVQTPQELIDKYKDSPEAEYHVFDADTIRQVFDKKRYAGTDHEFFLRNIRKVEVVALADSLKRVEEVDDDIANLEGYELIYSAAHNREECTDEGLKGMIKRALAPIFQPNFSVNVYARVKDDVAEDIIQRITLWHYTVIGYVEGKVKVKDLPELLAISFNSDADAVFDMDDVAEIDALIVIDGIVHPELHTALEASEYMKSKGIHFNEMDTILDNESVREKYPDCNKNVALEFTTNNK